MEEGALGSGDIVVHRNRFAGSRSAPVLVVSGAVASGPVQVTDNIFDDACDAARAVVTAFDPEVTLDGNVYCP